MVLVVYVVVVGLVAITKFVNHTQRMLEIKRNKNQTNIRSEPRRKHRRKTKLFSLYSSVFSFVGHTYASICVIESNWGKIEHKVL